MRIQNQAKPDNTTYLSGKAPKDDLDSFIYLDLQIMDLYSRVGAEQAIKYLKDKIQTIKKMQGGGK